MKTKISKVPKWLRWFVKEPALAMKPYILLSEEFYADYHSRVGADGKTIALVEHERVHIKRQQEMGLIVWGFRYHTSFEFCLEEELSAITAEMRVYKQYGLQFNVEGRANSLSTSWIYHRCVSCDDVVEKLESIWNNL